MKVRVRRISLWDQLSPLRYQFDVVVDQGLLTLYGFAPGFISSVYLPAGVFRVRSARRRELGGCIAPLASLFILLVLSVIPILLLTPDEFTSETEKNLFYDRVTYFVLWGSLPFLLLALFWFVQGRRTIVFEGQGNWKGYDLDFLETKEVRSKRREIERHLSAVSANDVPMPPEIIELDISWEELYPRRQALAIAGRWILPSYGLAVVLYGVMNEGYKWIGPVLFVVYPIIEFFRQFWRLNRFLPSDASERRDAIESAQSGNLDESKRILGRLDDGTEDEDTDLRYFQVFLAIEERDFDRAIQLYRELRAGVSVDDPEVSRELDSLLENRIESLRAIEAWVSVEQ